MEPIVILVVAAVIYYVLMGESDSSVSHRPNMSGLKSDKPEVANEPTLKSSTTRHIKPQKSNYEDFSKFFKENNITVLYHFTDISNIWSIKKFGGLVSWEEADRKGIQIPKPGGNEFSRNLDKGKGLGNYVRLCYHPNQPMKYVAERDGRITRPVLLKISTEVVTWSETLFSDQNATATAMTFGGDLNCLERLNIKLLKSGNWQTEDEKHQFQAEILVKEFLPVEYILNINDY